MSTLANLEIARRRAHDLIDSFGIDSPEQISVEDIAWSLGLKVQHSTLKETCGVLMSFGDNGIILANPANEGSYRFSVGHEISHFDLHRTKTGRTSCFPEDMVKGCKQRNPQEEEANTYAAELLMPRRLFEPRLRKGVPSLELIFDLASQFRTSRTATAIRYIDLSPYPCAIVVCQDNKILWYTGSEYFPYRLPIGGQLHKNTLAFDFAKHGIPVSGFEDVELEAWVSPETGKSAAYIVKEQATAFQYANQVMSLLYLKSQD